MDWIKGFAVATILAMPLPAVVATTASAASDATSATPATSEGKMAAMGDADKRAKAADCSKQADAKKLHGKERKTFREKCKAM